MWSRARVKPARFKLRHNEHRDKDNPVPIIRLNIHRSSLPRPRGRRIGIYGGSFNPAHSGHVAVSEAALNALGLDQVWWLVTPGNPLKSAPGASSDDRMATARKLATADRRILVTDVEKSLGTRYTADTVAALKRLYPTTDFVWIMGADNLIQLPRWHRWQDLVFELPIAVFSRPSYSYGALAGRAAQYMAPWRTAPQRLRTLVQKAPPAWGFFWLTRNGISSTALRQTPAAPLK